MSVTTSLELDLMGLIIYVSLLLPTPKILSLPFGPQDNAFLSWAHSYAALHNRSNCWVGLWSIPLFISGRLPMVDNYVNYNNSDCFVFTVCSLHLQLYNWICF